MTRHHGLPSVGSVPRTPGPVWRAERSTRPSSSHRRTGPGPRWDAVSAPGSGGEASRATVTPASDQPGARGAGGGPGAYRVSGARRSAAPGGQRRQEVRARMTAPRESEKKAMAKTTSQTSSSRPTWLPWIMIRQIAATRKPAKPGDLRVVPVPSPLDRGLVVGRDAVDDDGVVRVALRHLAVRLTGRGRAARHGVLLASCPGAMILPGCRGQPIRPRAPGRSVGGPRNCGVSSPPVPETVQDGG